MNLTVIGQLILVVTLTQGRRSYRPQKWRRPAAGKGLFQKGEFISIQELLRSFQLPQIAAFMATAEHKAPQTFNQMKNITNGYKFC